MEAVNSNQGVYGAGAPLQQPIDEAQVAQSIEEVLPLLSEANNVTVTGGETGAVRRDESKGRALESLPELDEAELESLKAISEDLEAVIALLTAEQDEKTLEATKKRIESLKAQIDQHHTTTMNKVNESLKAMKEQEDAALANKIFGWLGVAVGLICAAVMVCTVGGAAAGLAVAGAVLGLAMQTLNETGAMEKLVKAISESLKGLHPDWSKEACDAWAQGIVAAISIALSVALMVGGGFANAGTGIMNVTQAAKDVARMAMTISSIAIGTINVTSSGVSTVINYDAQMKQADVTDTQKLLVELQSLLDQENEDIKELLEQLQDAFATLIELLQSKQDALNDINQQIGA